jgi:hypothetical protein
MVTTASELSPLQAYNLLMAFASRYGENTLRLVLHAALPQVLRTDILHLLRLNFVPESMTDLDVEANVLFAPFCQDLGNGYYRFDQNVRLQLLQNLDPAYAEEPTPRSVLIAHFLLSYIEQQSRSSDRIQDRLYADYLEVERWGALGFLDPEVAAAQLAAALQQATSSSEIAVRIRVAGLATALSTPLARYGKLLAYAAGLEAMETGKFDQAKQLLESLDDAEIEIGKIRLKSSRRVLLERLQQPVETVAEEEDQAAEPQISETTQYFDSSVAIEPTERREGKLVIRYFVSYAHDDKALKDKLLKPLKQHLAIAKDYYFEAWDDGEILAGERWHEQIQEAIAHCQFGLLLISPAFLGSVYIQDHELRAFVASNLADPEPGKRAILVALENILFDGSIDLKGLERLQVFQDRAGRAFDACSTPRTCNDFASELFKYILRIVKRDALQRQWELLSKKLNGLYKQSIMETRVEEKLRLEVQIDNTKADLDKVEEQLKDIESQLAKVDSNAKKVASRNDDLRPRSRGLVTLFYSYAHEDEALRERLEVHLKLLQRQGIIQEWHDREISASREWKDQISEYLESAQIILLLISADFLVSDYCYDKEMQRALERHYTGEARVIPIILRSVDWIDAPFGKLQVLPKDARPVTSWLDQDTAFADIARGIRKVAEELAS